MTSRATVRTWHDDEGWGVLDLPETPGGCVRLIGRTVRGVREHVDHHR
ncbi:MAG: hypothetical protein ACR2JU_09765 [Nocardioidaceae bacterium]